MSRAKGQSVVALALFTGIAVVALGTVIAVTGPVLENIRDASAIDTAQNALSDLQTQVERVADGGEGSQVATSIQFSRGTFLFDAANDEIAYEIDTDAEPIAPHTSRQVGDLLMSAMADVTVSKVQVNGQDCWRMENQHVQVCIRAVDTPPNEIGADTVGFWRFSQGGGQVVVDNSTRGNNGTLGSDTTSENSDPSRTGGLRGNSLDFDGTDDEVQISDDGSLDVSNQTVSAWVNFNNLNHDGVVIGKDTQYRLWLDGSGNSDVRYELYIDGSWQCDARIDTGNLSAGTWHLLTGTYNGSYCRAYVDGSPLDTVAQTGSVGTSANTLGIGNTPGNSRFLNATVDDARIYNRSLTAEAVRYQYNATGYLDYVDTRDLLLRYRNKDQGENLSGEFKLKINTGLGGNGSDDFTMNGTGTVQPFLTGSHLGRGRVTADISSFYGIDYEIMFQLFSDSDFVQARVREG